MAGRGTRTSAGVGAGVTLLIVATLLLTGPLVGGGTPASTATPELGAGNATVDSLRFDGGFRIERGRFGSGVAYLRIPDMTARLEDVSENPRLVYSVRVPALGFERVGTELVTADGRTRVAVGMSDRAFDPESIDRPRYRATVTVRIQSFAVDRTVLSANRTVEVRLDG